MARRANGTGTVYEDKAKGRWVGAVMIDRRRHKVVGRTKTEARRRLDALIREADAGNAPVDGNATLGTALDVWEARVLPTKKAPGTRSVYAWCAQTWRTELGTTRLRSLTVANVERALDRLAAGHHGGRPASRATLVKLRSVLAQVLDEALRRDMVTKNVAKVARLTDSARGSTPRNVLDVEQVRQLWSVLDDGRCGPMFALALTTGLRPGEAAGLLWEDVDLDVGRIHVNHALQLDGRRHVITGELKTKRSRRVLDVPPDVVAMLRRLRTQQAAQRLAADTWADDRLVFATRNGRPYNPANVRRELRRLCDEAGAPVVLPNELRHSMASIMSDQGKPLEVIADQLGHTTTRMLEQTYRHRLAPSVSAGAEVMGAVLGG